MVEHPKGPENCYLSTVHIATNINTVLITTAIRSIDTIVNTDSSQVVAWFWAGRVSCLADLVLKMSIF